MGVNPALGRERVLITTFQNTEQNTKPQTNKHPPPAHQKKTQTPTQKKKKKKTKENQKKMRRGGTQGHPCPDSSRGRSPVISTIKEKKIKEITRGREREGNSAEEFC